MNGLCEQGVGVGGRGMLDVQRSFKLALLASCLEPRVFQKVIDMQITRLRVFPGGGGGASRCSVNTIMEMCSGFFGSDCLSWITRQSNEPVSAATVTE